MMAEGSGPERLTLASSLPAMRRRQWRLDVAIIVVLLLATLYSALSFAPKLAGTDDAMYLVTAKALATGQGYAKINLLGNPPEIYHPPGFALFLVPVMLLWPDWPGYIQPAAAISTLFMLLAITVTWRLFRAMSQAAGAASGATRTGDPAIHPWQSLLIVLVMATSYVGIGWYTTSVVLSETCFTFFTVLALLLLFTFSKRGSYPLLLAAGLSMGLAYLTRTVGIALMVAAFIFFLCRRQYKAASILAICSLAFVLPWTYHGQLVQRSDLGRTYRDVFLPTYWDTFRLKHWMSLAPGQAGLADYLSRLFTNINGHATQTIPSVLFPTLTGQRVASALHGFGLGWLPGLAGYTSLTLIALGWLTRLCQAPRLLEFYFLFYTAMILLPSWYSARNLVPVIPFLALYLTVGLVTVTRGAVSPLARASHRWRWSSSVERLGAGRLPGLVAGLVLVAVIGSNMWSARYAVRDGIEFRASKAAYVELWPGFLEACDWIKANTEPGDLVAYKSSDKIFLCTGRQTPPQLSTMPLVLGYRPADTVFEEVRTNAQWMVVTTTDQTQPLTSGEPEDSQALPELNQMIEQDQAHFHLAYETASAPTLRIYEVVR